MPWSQHWLTAAAATAAAPLPTHRLQVNLPIDWKRLVPRSSSGERLIMADDDLPYTDAELVTQVQGEYEEKATLGGQEALDACFR